MTSSKFSGRPFAVGNTTQTGLQPEDWKGQSPRQPKRQLLGVNFGRPVRKSSLHGSDVTTTKHTTSPTQPPPHFGSDSGVGQGFLCVVSQVVGDVGRSVAQSVGVFLTIHRKGMGNEKGSQRLLGDKVSKSPSQLGQLKAVRQ